MNNTAELREAVIEKAHTANDATLKSMLTVESAVADGDTVLKLDEAELEEIRRRMAKHKNGEGQIYTMGEIKDSLREKFGNGLV